MVLALQIIAPAKAWRRTVGQIGNYVGFDQYGNLMAGWDRYRDMRCICCLRSKLSADFGRRMDCSGT